LAELIEELAHDPDSALELIGRTNIDAQSIKFWGGLVHILAVKWAKEDNLVDILFCHGYSGRLGNGLGARRPGSWS
jgi:hypothetical protein